MNPTLVSAWIDAAVNDRDAATRMLAEHPELLSARHVHEETPLHFCAVEGYVDAVRWFASLGVPVDAPNDLGDPPLVDAVTLGNLEVVKALLELGASPDTTSPLSDAVLHIAVSHGYADVVDALLTAGARADYVTSFGETIRVAVPEESPLREEMLEVLARHRVAQ